MRLREFLIWSVLLLSGAFASAQQYTVKGKVTDAHTGWGVPFVLITLDGNAYSANTDSSGYFVFRHVKEGPYSLFAGTYGYKDTVRTIRVDSDLTLHIVLSPSVITLGPVHAGSPNDFSLKRLEDVEGTTINAGKKTEVIEVGNMTVNTATNNTRQVYSKIPGLNIWENDGAGIQLGIGGRGLNPNRTSNFNTRQNGYDISADALGYPESYYTPPAEAVDRIEIIRGAGSLQYGPQFGGFINFRLKKAPEDKEIELTSRTTAGSFGFLNLFNSLGGTKKKISYYTFYQHKRGNGWRENSEFNVNTAFASLTYRASEKFSLTGEYTFMHYLARQPGGLTDQMFYADPRQSMRERNWFRVNWNLAALILDYRFNSHLKLNSRFFGLAAGRDALGLLIAPNRMDPMSERDLWVDKFMNFGNETRLLYLYDLGKELSALLVGFRYYNGFTERRQGFGNDGTEGRRSDFSFANPEDLEYSEFDFPSNNKAVFVENVFQVSPAFSLTPGARYEFIHTEADGFYNLISRDLAGNIIYKEKITESRSSSRSFLIFGAGTSYKTGKDLELYGNISQNYRSINFNDMRVVNPNLRVDENLQDEKGYSADAGIRGNIRDILNYDLSVFYLSYNNRIGTVIRYDSVLYNTYRFRTNISQSRNVGVESFAETDIWKLVNKNARSKVLLFGNFSFIRARYLSSEEKAFHNKHVELVPEVILKTGLTFKRNKFSVSYQFSYVSEQYTEATNAVSTANGVNGLIPAYYVMDMSVKYSFRRYQLSGSVNNLTNDMYFTRRAEGYPGPGIIPSDGRAFYLTFQMQFGKSKSDDLRSTN